MCRYMRLPIAFRDNQQISLADSTMMINRLPMESAQIISQTRAKAGHLLRLGNHRQIAATRTTSRSLSIEIGEPQSLSRHRGTMYLNTSTCWAQTQQSHQAHAHMRFWRAMKHPATSQKLKVSGSRLPRTARFQMSWKTTTFHHSPWHRDRDRHRHKSLVTYPVN